MRQKAIETSVTGSLIFASAALIFDGPVQTAIDDRKAYGEERIISARHANKKEREIWQSFVNR